jgi:hypothetical protein
MYRCVLLLALAWLALGLTGASQEPKVLEPVNLAINTPRDEDDPHVSSNHLALYYASNGNKKLEIMVSLRKTVNEAWPAGAVVPHIKSRDADFRSPFLTAEGKFPQRIYYSSNMDPLTKGARGDNYDIYYQVKQDAKADFGSYISLNPVDTERDEMHPWITPDDRQIYFSRKTEGGWRQFVATRPADGGQFAAPVQLKLPLGHHHATLTPDGKTMYLQGPLEAKGDRQRWGLFVSTSTGKDAWTKPTPLTTLNSATAPTGDMSPSLSRDGALLYFVSDRPGGKGGKDIWMVPTADLKK